jgi:hypothetical protein
MNCDLACRLIDDYLQDRLSRHDRHRLETHLASCRACSEEFRARPAFDRSLWHALTASVQHLQLSPETSMRIVRASQASRHRAVWSSRATLTLQAMAVAAAVAIVLVGALIITGRIQNPLGIAWSTPMAGEPSTEQVAVSLTRDDVYMEPWSMQPGEPFTITLYLHSNLPQPVDVVRLDLDISGPAGDYRFALAARGPLPAQGVSVVQMTPDTLAAFCDRQYQITPTEMFGAPGIYTLKATVFSPLAAKEQ